MKKRICRRWGPREIEMMRRHYSRPGGVDFLMKELGRSRSALWVQAQRLKIPHYMFLIRGAKGIKGNRGEGARMTVETLKQMTVEKENGCWEWSGHRHKFGYGTLMIDHVTTLVHRLMFTVANPGVDIDGFNVNHHCDNAPCVNPDHLYRGTQKDNIHDQLRRGRHRWQRHKESLAG
jgi:hypothetical protein